MNRFEFAEPFAGPRPESAAEKAERVLREAEQRRPGVASAQRQGLDRAAGGTDSASAPLAPDDPAPLSSALGIPTLLKEPPHEPGLAPRPDNPAPLSSALGIPTLLKETRHEPGLAPRADNAAPLSSALGIPTLLKEQHREPPLRPGDPAPFSRLLGLPVLINERPSRGAEAHYPLSRSHGSAAGRDHALTRTDEAPALAPYGSAPAHFSRLDMTAWVFAALMTLGPLFAAFVGRMRG